VQGDPGAAAGEDAAGARGPGPGVQYTGQENRDPQPPGGLISTRLNHLTLLCSPPLTCLNQCCGSGSGIQDPVPF